MHVFYTPDIQKSNELPEEEAQHCTRVLRLGIGDEITLTDGKGNFYKAEITVATNKRCFVTIKETIFQEPLWPCHLHIAMAPTKNMDRNEWFVSTVCSGHRKERIKSSLLNSCPFWRTTRKERV